MTRGAWATALGGLIALGCAGDDFSARAGAHAAGAAGKVAASSSGADSGGSASFAQAGEGDEGGADASPGGGGRIVGTPKGGHGGADEVAHSGSGGGAGRATHDRGGAASSGGSGGTGGGESAGAAGEMGDSGGAQELGGTGSGGSAGGGTVGCNDDPVLVSIHVYEPLVSAVIDNNNRALHSLSTWFKDQRAYCIDAYGGGAALIWLSDGQTGEFPVPASDICLKDSLGVAGAVFKTMPDSYPGDTTLLQYVKDWSVTQFCLRVATNRVYITSDGPLIDSDEVWEIHGHGMPYPAN